jgi:hypothetical protein
MVRSSGLTGVPVARLPWLQVRAGALRAWERHARAGRWPAQSWVIFEQVVRLVWLDGRGHPDRPGYTWCSEAYLADRAGVARETCSRWVRRLKAAALLVVRRRRQEAGRWVTNLYLLGAASLAVFVRKVRPSRPEPQRERHAIASHSLSNNASVTVASHGEEFVAIVGKWLARGAGQEGVK